MKTEIRKHWRIHTLRRQSLVSSRSTRTFSVQSTTFGKDQDLSKYKDKTDNSSRTVIKQVESIPSWGKDKSNYEIIKTDGKDVGNFPFSHESELKTKMKDDNENVAFLPNQKVSFF